MPSRGGSDKMHTKCFDLLCVLQINHPSTSVINLQFYTLKVEVKVQFSVGLHFKDSNCKDEGLTESSKCFF